MLEEALVNKKEWPYELPENWVWVKIIDAFKLINEKVVPRKNEILEYVGLEHLSKNGGLDSKSNTENLKSAKTFFQDGDVLYGKLRPYLDKHCVVDFKGVCSTDILVFRSKSSFMPYLLNKYFSVPFVVQYFTDNSKGINLPRVSPKIVSDFPLPLPPIEEQKRIVKTLSSMLSKLKEAKDLIQEAKDSFENRRAAILNLAFTRELTKKWRGENPIVGKSALKTSIIDIPYRIPGQWRWMCLKDVCEKFQYGTSTKSDTEGEIPVLRMGNIQNGRIDWNDLKFTSDEKEIKKYNLNFNDVLFNRTNSPELVGKTAIYKGEMPALFAGYLIRVKPQKDLDPDYLNYYLNSPYAKQMCLKVKTDGVNQSNINAKKLGNFEIPIPDINEQQEIVKMLDKLLVEEDNAKDLIDLENHIDLLEKSILSKAFRGELGTHDPNDEPAIKLLEKVLAAKNLIPENPKKSRERKKKNEEKGPACPN